MAITDTGVRFDFGRVTSRIFSLISRNFVPFAVLSLIFAGLPAAVILFMQPGMIAGAAASQDQTSMLLVVYGAVFVSYLAGLVLSAALTRASVDDLSGRPVALGAALATGVSLILPMLGLGIVMGIGIVFGLFLLIVPGVFLALCWAVAAPTMPASGSCNASRISLLFRVKLRGTPSLRLRPLTSISLTSEPGKAEPISFLMVSAVVSPISMP